MIKIINSLLCCIVVFSLGCQNFTVTKPPFISIDTLAQNIASYDAKQIRTSGYPEYVSEQSYFLPTFYYDPIFKIPRTGLSEVLITTYRLHVNANFNDPYVVLLEETRGSGMLPITMAPRNRYSKEIEVEGRITKEGNGSYYVKPEYIAEKNK